MKKVISLWICLALVGMTMAKPAYRGPITKIAENGTEKTVYLHGNEHFHYMTDEEGVWLNEKTLAPLSPEERSKREEAFLVARARRAPQEKKTGGKPNVSPRGLVILVDFQDTKFKTATDTMANMLSGENYTRSYSYRATAGGKLVRIRITSKGSARQYFYDQSYGQYNPQFDLIGPVTVSQNAEYYGQNSAGSDMRAREMIKEACQLADAAGADFSLYDNDNDGKVDFVYVIYAGFGEADGGGASTIWPHQWSLDGMRVRCDGKYISRYACGCELNYASKVYDGIGTFCHEFSHVLGLPDFYETNDESLGLHTLCNWDIMDYGPYNNDGNTPPAYSAYERFYMGWLTPRLLTEPEKVTLHDINEGSGESLIITASDKHNLIGWNPNPTTFYLLETRKKDGWDKYLPGEGMLITKVRYNAYNWQSNKVNNTEGAMGVDILEAKENTSLKAGADTDAFPKGANQWTGLENHEITNITRGGVTGMVTFFYRGGPQGIEDIEDGQTAHKIIRDGKIIIIRNGVTYDLNGRVQER